MNENKNACLYKLLKANLIAFAAVVLLFLLTSSFWTSLKIVYVSAGIPISMCIIGRYDFPKEEHKENVYLACCVPYYISLLVSREIWGYLNVDFIVFSCAFVILLILETYYQTLYEKSQRKIEFENERVTQIVGYYREQLAKYTTPYELHTIDDEFAYKYGRRFIDTINVEEHND